MYETLLQAAVIADENGAENVGKTNYGNEELAFLACLSCKCDQKG